MNLVNNSEELNQNNIYTILKDCLYTEASKANILDSQISINCKVLTAMEAIGDPEHKDYPILTGKESMVEAEFMGEKGQAFADDFENIQYSINELINLNLDSNKKRASFIAAYNAIFRHLGLCGKTIHCRDEEPVSCAEKLHNDIPLGTKVLLIGYQPRFLEYLAGKYEVRIVDLDEDNIGHNRFGVMVEPPEATDEAMDWCDLIFATGSTIVNGSIIKFINSDKPALFYGTSIAGPAISLNLSTYCQNGH